MGRSIEFIARGLCLRGDDLLVCVNTKSDYGYLPGGHVEFGESAEAAVVREFLEESGEPVVCGLPLLGMELTFRQGLRDRHEVTLVFPVKHSNLPNEVRSLEAGIRFEWWELSTLAARDLRPAQLRDWILRSVAGRKSASAKMEWISLVVPLHNP